MRAPGFILGLLLLGSAGCAPESAVGLPADKDAAAVSAGPLVAEPAAVELGHVWIGERRELLVRVRNTAEEAVEALELRTSCGCAVVSFGTPGELPGRRDRLDAGEEVEIVVVVEVDGGDRRIEKEVRVLGARGVSLRIPLTADATTLWRSEPAVLDFGQVVSGTSARASAVVEAADGASYEIFGVEPGVMVPEATFRRGEGGRVHLDVASAAGLRPGQHREFVVLRTSHPRVPRMMVPATIQIEEAWVVSPARVDFGISRGAAERRLRVERKAPGPGPAPRAEVHMLVQDDGLGPHLPRVQAVVVEHEAGRVWEVSLRVRADASPGSLAGRVEICVDEEGFVPRAVPITGVLGS